MPPRQQQSKAAMYSAIFFAAVFIVATVFAVVFYVKAEDFKKAAEDLRSEQDKFARTKESKLIGSTKKGKTVLGTMLNYFDTLITDVAGESEENITADIKFDQTQEAIDTAFGKLADSGFEPGENSLVRIIELLNQGRLNALGQLASGNQQLEKLQDDLDTLQNQHLAAEEQWQQELAGQKQVADQARQHHDQLEQLIDDKFGDQLNALNNRLDQTRQLLQQKEDGLLKARAELQKTEKRLKHYLGIIESIKPQPLKDIKAYRPDGEIVSVDQTAGIVILNVGSDDHVYPGLTFAVYNKNAPIPPDGKGKAEVEVFDVKERISIARIMPETVDAKQSIIAEDPIANLIWNADATDTFVIAGSFDMDSDGRADTDGPEKIKQLIEGWGAKVGDEVTIDTDFVVLGQRPIIPGRPSIEDLDIDPAAMDKYNAVVAAQQRYNDIIEQVKAFSIPVFDYSRFMYFIGQGGMVKD